MPDPGNSSAAVERLGLGRRPAAIVGVGMVPRGEVGIIVGTVGLAEGVIGPDLYGVVVAMSILPTLAVPPFLKLLFSDRPGGERRARGVLHTPDVDGIGG